LYILSVIQRRNFVTPN